MIIYNIILLLFLHWVGDFLLQNDYLILNKTKNLKLLFLHSLIYSGPFLYFGLIFATITGSLHFAVDYLSSKIGYCIFKKYTKYWFLIFLGLDQLIHQILLILTYSYLYNVL